MNKLYYALCVIKFSNRSAAGPDNIRPTFFKNNIENIKMGLLNLINIIMITGIISTQMKTTYLRLISRYY